MARHGEAGMVTAEYTVGTVGAVFIALLLFKLSSMVGVDSPVFEFLSNALNSVISDILGDAFRWVPRLWR